MREHAIIKMRTLLESDAGERAALKALIGHPTKEGLVDLLIKLRRVDKGIYLTTEKHTTLADQYLFFSGHEDKPVGVYWLTSRQRQLGTTHFDSYYLDRYGHIPYAGLAYFRQASERDIVKLPRGLLNLL